MSGEEPMTQAKAVRSWAREQGFEMGVRGKIAPAIWDAYAKAHDGFEREKPVGLWRCLTCKREWTGNAECHCTMCHRHFSTVSNFDRHRHGVCVDPTTLEGSYEMRVKETMWGPIYVNAREHYLTGDGAGLYDNE